MKLGTLLLRLLLLVLLAAGAAQWWLLRESQAAAQRFIAQWESYGQLRYERLWMQLWGSGRIWNLSFEPGGLTQAMLGTPFGYRVTARELVLRDVDLADDGSAERVSLHIADLRLPVIDTYGGNPRLPIGFAELGYRELEWDLDLELRFVPEARLILLRGTGRGRELAKLDFSAQIEAEPAQLQRAPDQIGLRQLRLDYEEGGLMQRYKNVAAARLQLSAAAAEQALIAQLDARAARAGWRWDAASAEAVREFIRRPGRARLVLDPPGEVILRNVPLYARKDWPQLLGFSFSLQPAGAGP